MRWRQRGGIGCVQRGDAHADPAEPESAHDGA